VDQDEQHQTVQGGSRLDATAQAWTKIGPIMTTAITDFDDFRALDPFFRIIEKGLEGIADGGHFFDLLAEDVIFDYIITTPGYPRRVGRFRGVDLVPVKRRQHPPPLNGLRNEAAHIGAGVGKPTGE
jgi:hypothetical protein